MYILCMPAVDCYAIKLEKKCIYTILNIKKQVQIKLEKKISYTFNK